MTPFDNMPDEFDRDDPLSYGDFVKLPFDAPIFWWTNGSAKGSKENSGVDHFGGWATDAISLNDMQEVPVNDNLFPETMLSEEGSYETYCARFLTVAVIGKRFRWVIDETKPGDKGRGHSQILCLSAIYSKTKPPLYWMPVVLSAKGMASKYLDDAFRAFDKVTTQGRKQHAKGLPWFYFWTLVGTFGDTREAIEVGSKQKNYIVPPSSYAPPDVEKYLERFYIGNSADVLKIRDQCKLAAQDWLNAWKKPKGEQQGYSNEPVDVGENIPF